MARIVEQHQKYNIVNKEKEDNEDNEDDEDDDDDGSTVLPCEGCGNPHPSDCYYCTDEGCGQFICEECQEWLVCDGTVINLDKTLDVDSKLQLERGHVTDDVFDQLGYPNDVDPDDKKENEIENQQ